jgi:cytochrome P450
MANGPSTPDLNTVFVDPFIASASSRAAGIPSEDWSRLRSLSDATLALVETPDDIAAVKEAWSGLYEYCDGFITNKDNIPKDSILSSVITALEGQEMNPDNLLAVFATIINGFPTPGPVLSVCALELMRRPEAVEACLQNPDLWPATVEELMRYRAHFAAVLPRVAVRNVLVDNVSIQEGQLVIPSLRAALHDPARTENPTEFDIDQKASRSLVFGSGAHLCPGAALTRQWLAIALKELFTTLPNLRLAIPEEDLNWQRGMLPVPTEIPIKWGDQ